MQHSTESTGSHVLRDMLDVRPHPTVVRLGDLEDGLEGSTSDWITKAYHVTDDVKKHLHSLRLVLEKPTGLGMFVVGQYGAGKSHFLAYVARELQAKRLAPSAPDVRTISLLNFRSEVAMEDIVCETLGIDARGGDRRVPWEAVAKRWPGGLLLVLDELSEFLRSKADHRLLNEDVRFLQFLGEWAQDHRFWILAAVQEEVEHVGGLDHGLYRKIKDRYPLRFLLTAAHVKDLLSGSILVKKEGYSEAVKTLVRDLRSTFHGLPMRWDDLLEIYPIHPATLELLEEVRDRFSQARGIVDFTVTRLRGDPTRGIEPFLDRPWGSLLAPDAIVEHFRDLFELQPEFVPIAQQVFPHYRRHLGEVFETDVLRSLALRVLNLLILFHISPARKTLTAQDAACFLLYRATRIDPAQNVRVMERILKGLAERGGYVEDTGRGFQLCLEDDGGSTLDLFLEREKVALRDGGVSIFERLASLLRSDEFNPFSLAREAWQSRAVKWRFHERLYSVFLGSTTPPPAEGMGFCLRLPWGESTPTPGLYSVEPARIDLGEEHLELAALLRAKERPWPESAERRIAARLGERRAVFKSQVQNAYLSGALVLPGGGRDALPRLANPGSFGTWLDLIAEVILRRTYPAFERFAPAYGPLPKETIRTFVRHSLSEEGTVFDGGDAVQVVREGYLVPMNLVRRTGRTHETAERPERNELVQLVLPLLEFQPSPKSVYEHLAQPIYGLVQDQVTVLLVFLFLSGEIDILKDRKSYRELFETMPNPIQYDRIVAATALRAEQVGALETLLGGLGIKPPRHWTVMAQRQALARLLKALRERGAPLQALLWKLERSGEGPELAERLRAWSQSWKALDGEDDLVVSFERFLSEIGSARRFLSTLSELEGLPGRIDQLSRELARLKHLFTQVVAEDWLEPAVDLRVRSVPEAPGLDRPDAAEEWISRARESYALYREAYKSRHDAWWKACLESVVWNWKPPRLASSRHLSLERELREITEFMDRASRSVCRGLVNLDFQARCSCGFDGKSHLLSQEVERLAVLHESVDRSVRDFFARDEVKLRVQSWAQQGLEDASASKGYLGGVELFPEVGDLEAFDRHLAGVEVLKTVNSERLLDLLEGRVWGRETLLETLRGFVKDLGVERFRFVGEERGGRSSWIAWCAELSLRHGVPLPEGLGTGELKALAEAVRLEWVGPQALARLESLGFDDAAVDRILAGLFSGAVSLSFTGDPSPVVLAAAQVLRPVDAETPEALAKLSEALYSEHARLLGVAREPWLERLDRLACRFRGDELPGLLSLLKGESESQWVVIDCLGLPLLGPFQKALSALLPSWRLASLRFASVSAETSTDAFFRSLASGGVRRALEKVDCVDSLLHQRFLPLRDISKLALAELQAALRSVRKRLNPALPVLLFADHGFRIEKDGNAYVHGGSSWLERIVPVFELGAL